MGTRNSQAMGALDRQLLLGYEGQDTVIARERGSHPNIGAGH